MRTETKRNRKSLKVPSEINLEVVKIERENNPPTRIVRIVFGIEGMEVEFGFLITILEAELVCLNKDTNVMESLPKGTIFTNFTTYCSKDEYTGESIEEMNQELYVKREELKEKILDSVSNHDEFVEARLELLFMFDEGKTTKKHWFEQYR